jgi:quercetin dioxygenase-like cupin family protein
MPHVTSSSAGSFRLHGVEFHSYVNSSAGAAQLAAWRSEFAPNTTGQAHRMTHEEVLYLLAGRLEVEVDDERFTAETGDAVLVPPGALFRVSNSAAEPATAWVTTSVGMAATMEAEGQRVTPPWAQ